MTAARGIGAAIAGRLRLAPIADRLRLAPIVLVAIAGCGAPAPPRPPDPEPPKENPDVVVVRLVEAGAEPLRRLRFHPPAGTTFRFAIGGPCGTSDFEARVEKGSDDHDTKVSVSPRDPRAAVDGGLGLTAEGRLGDRGIVDYRFEPIGVGPMSYRFHRAAERVGLVLEGIVPVLPEEPVGVGARWEVRRPLWREYTPARVLLRYELVQADGDRLRLRVDGLVEPRLGFFDPPNAILEETYEAVAAQGQGHGDLDVDLGAPIAAGTRELSWTVRVRHTESRRIRGVLRSRSEIKDRTGGDRLEVLLCR
jgi:hypothetical protein